MLGRAVASLAILSERTHLTLVNVFFLFFFFACPALLISDVAFFFFFFIFSSEPPTLIQLERAKVGADLPHPLPVVPHGVRPNVRKGGLNEITMDIVEGFILFCLFFLE